MINCYFGGYCKDVIKMCDMTWFVYCSSLICMQTKGFLGDAETRMLEVIMKIKVDTVKFDYN